MDKIRVVIVDDSSLSRGLLRDILEEDAGFVVVGEARDGRQAVELAQSLRPDLITMDLEMPRMHGLDAIEAIMTHKAVPILVVSAVADARNAYAAVSRGAVDVVGKPSIDPQEARTFVAKARLVARVPVITRVRGAPPAPAPPPRAPLPRAPAVDASQRLFAIAASTGGPPALARLLGLLPAGFPCPVLIVQHISDGFAQGMAEWLASVSNLPVRMAREGDLPAPGTVYVSPSEQNLTVAATRRLHLSERQPKEIYHPNCDRLLESVAAVYRRQAVGIILTGMGRDGAAGLAAIVAAGGYTIAQDEATSVVFGMNGLAVARGAASVVLPLDRIAAEMARLAGVAA